MSWNKVFQSNPKNTVTAQEIEDLESRVIEMENRLKQPELTHERDRFGTLHVNLLSLARALEQRFGFVRGR